MEAVCKGGRKVKEAENRVLTHGTLVYRPHARQGIRGLDLATGAAGCPR